MVENLLIQEAGAHALRLCPQGDNIDKQGTRFYFEINQKPNWKPRTFDTKGIFINLSKDVQTKHGLMTVQDSKPDFETIEEALDFLKEKFNQEYYFMQNEKMLRGGLSVEEILGLPNTRNIKILEDEALLFIAKNPHTTKKDLLFAFGADTAEYVQRWKHDYGNGKSPLIEWSDISEGWIITPQGLTFLEDPEASY